MHGAERARVEALRYGGTSHDQPSRSPSWNVSIVTPPRWGTKISSATRPAEDEEGVGRIALAQQVLAGLEDRFRAHPATVEVLADSPLNAASSRAGPQSSAIPLASSGEAARSVARIAAASSVMSIATGHHVMQRPQPTQPEVPNWSIQLASLWVIHWR